MTNQNKDLMTQKEPGPSRPNRNLFKDCLTRSLLENDGQKMRQITDRLLEIATGPTFTPEQQMAAFKLIIERVEGRPSQQVEIHDNTDKPSAGLFKIVKVE